MKLIKNHDCSIKLEGFGNVGYYFAVYITLEAKSNSGSPYTIKYISDHSGYYYIDYRLTCKEDAIKYILNYQYENKSLESIENTININGRQLLIKRITKEEYLKG